MTRAARRTMTALPYLVGAGCLVWLVGHVRAEEILGRMRGLDWSLVVLAIVVDVASYALQGWRWKLLLRPVGPLSWIAATQAIYVGLFASELLPMRPGEVVRAYVASRSLRARIASVVPSIIVERLFDGVWLAIGLGVTAMVVPLPRDLVKTGNAFGGAVLAATGGFLYIVLRARGREAELESKAAAAHTPVARAARRFLADLERDLRGIGLSRATWAAFAISCGLLAGQVLAFWLIMRAYGLALSVWIGAAVLLIVHLGTAVPSTPANVGTYQLFTVLGLRLFGVDASLAAGFSIVVFVVLTVPLWALGYIALVRAHLSLASLKAQRSAHAA